MNKRFFDPHTLKWSNPVAKFFFTLGAAFLGILLLGFGVNAIYAPTTPADMLPGGNIAIWLTALLLIGLSVVLMREFRNRVKSNQLCTYRTVATLGLFIFFSISAALFCFLGIIIVVLQANITMGMLLYLFNRLAIYFAALDVPIIGLIAVFLVVSNVLLMRHEGFRPTNTLGFILNLAILAGYILVMFMPYPMESVILRAILIGVQIALAYVMSYFESMYLALIICGVIAAHGKPEFNKDAVIILGCGIREDGTPTPLLKGRIDRALEFINKQEEATGKQAAFVCSGGQGSDEVISEAQCMANYLMSQGVPSQRILLEDKSTNTLENMRFSKKLLDERIPNAKVAFSTTNYHVLRSGMFAVEAGLDAQYMGADTKWYFWPNAFIREMVGFFAVNRKMTLAISLSVLVFGMLIGFTSEMPII